MNIYNRTQIKSWDAFTILHEPISSIDLMERAAGKLYDWLAGAFPFQPEFICICGNGNNGGDGLALARLLFLHGYGVRVFLSGYGSMSTDCRENLDRLKLHDIKVDMVGSVDDLPEIPETAVLIDALYGTGLTRPLEGSMAGLVRFINSLPNRVISIDMPSGLPADTLAANDAIVEADITLTLQCPKYAFFLPEHAKYTGEWVILDIGLHPAFEPAERTPYAYIDASLIEFFKPSVRAKHSHKGNYGHAVLAGGSEGMAGALMMAVQACLRSGTGLVSAAVSDAVLPIMQAAIPEAMCAAQPQWMNHLFYQGKTAVGAGMGWQTDEFHARLLQWLISNVNMPLLLDASALNILSGQMEWLTLRPANSVTVLTPHLGEFTRLAGKSTSSTERLERAKSIASRYRVFVVLKGAYTAVITPGGLVYFNSTGNPGMAKGGSGDVLAGFITGLLAQSMAPTVACLLGVYLHGLAGDIAAREKTEPGMTAMDIANDLPKAWAEMLHHNPDKFNSLPYKR
jgi:ADP-dependent NAD(P)H-hydrate dehydratase / NAD(P)H-hydrate epimerase